MNIADLSAAWMEAKKAEENAVDARRAIEDQISKALALKEGDEGSLTRRIDGFIIKTTCRLNHKIDGEMLQELAQDAGIGTDVLSGLFRWKPEMNAKEWRAASPTITGALAGAITTTAGRTSYSITKED